MNKSEIMRNTHSVALLCKSEIAFRRITAYLLKYFSVALKRKSYIVLKQYFAKAFLTMGKLIKHFFVPFTCKKHLKNMPSLHFLVKMGH